MKIKRILVEANNNLTWDEIIKLLQSGNEEEKGKLAAINYFKDLSGTGEFNKFGDLLETFKPKFILEFMTSLTEADAKQQNNRILNGFKLILKYGGRDKLALGYDEKLFRSIYNTLLNLVDINKFTGNRLNDLLKILTEPNFYSIPYKDQRLIYNDFIKYANIIGDEPIAESLLEDKVLPSGLVVTDSTAYEMAKQQQAEAEQKAEQERQAAEKEKALTKEIAKQHIKELINSIKSNTYKNVIDTKSSNIDLDDDTTIKNAIKELSREYGDKKVKKAFENIYKS